ncbi:MAG: hypothetical protein QM535_19370 [Limnohabitans sp.]|nr:hypothetical protein [Limnohabitans sp.]
MSLREELEDFKFGSDRLLRQAVDYFNNKQLDSAEAKLNLLISKHNETKEAIEGRALLAKIPYEREQLEDLTSWKSAESSEDIGSIEKYKTMHPNGRYLSLADEKISELKVKNEQTAYNNALNQNSSYVWKKFLEDYPNRYDVEEINDRIINSEIAEIAKQDGVSSLPASYQIDYGNTEISTVTITNNTSYTLTVRYSGPVVESISIPSGGTKIAYLASGSYRVAATAGTTSCAGTERLNGSYRSSYSITTSTYRSPY